MPDNGFNIDNGDYEEESKPFTFDDAVSFTMYLEVLLIFSAIAIFLFYLYMIS